MRIAVVKAALDDDAGVSYVEHSDIDGLRVEGETFEVFRRNVVDAAGDLLFGEGGGSEDVHIGDRRGRVRPRRRRRVRDFGKFVRLPPPLTLVTGAGLAR